MLHYLLAFNLLSFYLLGCYLSNKNLKIFIPMIVNKYGNLKKDIPTTELPECPTDSISDIALNFQNTHLAVSSWDGTVKIYKLPLYPNNGYNCVLEKTFTLGKPVLSCTFFNNSVFAGLVDGSIVVTDTNQSIPAHQAGVKGLKNFNNEFLISGSFDSTLKIWDLKSSEPLFNTTLPGKIYCMDIKDNFLVIGLSDKSVMTYMLPNVNEPVPFTTKFNHSIRSIACHRDLDTFAIGGIEGKTEYFSRTIPSKRQVLRNHRNENKLYSVNTIDFNPNDSRIVITGGSDGNLTCYDKINRTKLFTNEYQAPVTVGKFSNDGKYFFFATGDDWSKGYTGTTIKPSLKMLIVSNIPGL